MVIIESGSFSVLIDAIKKSGYTVVGPVVRGGAIVLEEIDNAGDLAKQYVSKQEAGKYRLEKDNRCDAVTDATGPHSWKKFLFPSTLKFITARRNGKSLELQSETGADTHVPRYAFIGVHACELAAITIQDTIFLRGKYIDDYYKKVREQVLIVALNCTHPGGTCFCASMKTGPKVTAGFDLALTEIAAKDKHGFLVETGSENGKELLRHVPYRPAAQSEIDACGSALEKARKSMGRMLDTGHIKELLYANLEHPEWDAVAKRCLSCANCTMVCPTCFCSQVEDVTDLAGGTAERSRRWDSCFTLDFSYIHGGSVRPSVKARYRQWLTHKLAGWYDQFGMSGCVGCGRCITWCPVGIDITEEAAVIRKSGEQHLTPVLKKV
jgi:ferredoxin